VTKDSQFLLEEIGKKQDRIDVLQIKINDNQAETQKLFSTYQGFQQTVAELSLMKEKIAHTKETMASLSKEMQEYTESDEDLIDMRDSFDQRNKEAQEVMKDKNNKRKQLSDELQRVREELGKRTVDVGALEEAKRANDRNAARREEVVKEVSRRHGFRGMEVIMDDGEIDKMKTLLLQSLKDEKGQLDRIKVYIFFDITNIA
jgi:DNA repair protein RAD50